MTREMPPGWLDVLRDLPAGPGRNQPTVSGTRTGLPPRQNCRSGSHRFTQRASRVRTEQSPRPCPARTREKLRREPPRLRRKPHPASTPARRWTRGEWRLSDCRSGTRVPDAGSWSASIAGRISSGRLPAHRPQSPSPRPVPAPALFVVEPADQSGRPLVGRRRLSPGCWPYGLRSRRVLSMVVSITPSQHVGYER